MTLIGRLLDCKIWSLTKFVNGTSAVGINQWFSPAVNKSSPNFGNCPVPNKESLLTKKGTCISVYPFSFVCLSNINWAIALSNFESIPFSITKRDPESLLAKSKFIKFKFSPIS